MSELQIHLFGRMYAHFNGESAEVNLGPNAKSLLAYFLLTPRQSHARDVLCDLLWGERPEEKARACLNTTLWRLRSALRTSRIEADTYIITTESGQVGFNWECEHWLDLSAFETSAVRFLARPVDQLAPEHVKAVESDMALYVGDLLEGFYDYWALQERERMRLLYLDCLAHLMRYYRRQEAFEQSLRYGHIILRIDPLRENIHRELMRLHWHMGNRTQAIQQYKTCHEILAEELDVVPMPETLALYAQIIAREQSSLPRSGNGLAGGSTDRPQQVTIQEISQQLIHTMQELNKAQSELSHVIHQLEQWYAGQASRSAGQQ